MTVPDGAPKHIEWGDRMAQAVSGAAADLGTIDGLTHRHPDSYKRQTLDEAFARLRKWLIDLDQVRDEIINSNLEKVVRYLAEASPDICDERSSGAMYNVDPDEVLAAKKLIELWAVEEPNGG